MDSEPPDTVTPEQFYWHVLTDPDLAVEALGHFDVAERTRLTTVAFTYLLWLSFGKQMPSEAQARKATRFFIKRVGWRHRRTIRGLTWMFNNNGATGLTEEHHNSMDVARIMIAMCAAMCDYADPDRFTLHVALAGLMATTAAVPPDM